MTSLQYSIFVHEGSTIVLDASVLFEAPSMARLHSHVRQNFTIKQEMHLAFFKPNGILLDAAVDTAVLHLRLLAK